MTNDQRRFIKGCFLLLSGGTLPIAFMGFTNYLIALMINMVISIALAMLLY